MVEEIPLKVDKRGTQAINEMVKKRQNYIITKNDFHSQRRALEKCTLKDLQEMFPISGGKAFEASCAMVKRTEQKCEAMNQFDGAAGSITTMVAKGQVFLPAQEPGHARTKKQSSLGIYSDKQTANQGKLNSQWSKMSINDGESQIPSSLEAEKRREIRKGASSRLLAAGSSNRRLAMPAIPESGEKEPSPGGASDRAKG